MNGNGGGKATGKPCAGCVGKADNKNPKGQRPNGSDHNNGYECDGNHGIGRGNPAHTGCQPSTPGDTCTPKPGEDKYCHPVPCTPKAGEDEHCHPVPCTPKAGEDEHCHPVPCTPKAGEDEHCHPIPSCTPTVGEDQDCNPIPACTPTIGQGQDCNPIITPCIPTAHVPCGHNRPPVVLGVHGSRGKPAVKAAVAARAAGLPNTGAGAGIELLGLLGLTLVGVGAISLSMRRRPTQL
jgi:LPXTG-motif cell wall-anchored protein